MMHLLHALCSTKLQNSIMGPHTMIIGAVQDKCHISGDILSNLSLIGVDPIIELST